MEMPNVFWICQSIINAELKEGKPQNPPKRKSNPKSTN